MVYEERNMWSSLFASLIGVVAYVVVVLQQAAGRPLTEVSWWPVMLWTIGGSIVAAIVVSVVWGIIAGARGGRPAHAPDRAHLAAVPSR